MSFLAELKRRNVFRVGIAYAAAAWVLLQVLDVVGEILELPAWGGKLILAMIVAGFFVTLFVAWAFELTPEGIKRESEVDRSQSFTTQTGRKLDRVIIGFLVIAVVILLGDRFIPTPAIQEATKPGDRASQTSAAQDLDAAGKSLEKSIAVLPLINLSTLAENAFFVGGLHDEILNYLSRIDGLQVVSRTSVMPYFDTDKSLRVIGEELDADYVLEGSVRRIDDHVRVIVQLIEASSDHHLWANNFDRELEDEFGIQSAVAGEIARSIQRELLPDSAEDVSGLPTDSVRAYDLYTRAQNKFRTEVESESNFRRQRELLEQAVAEDPEFVEAWGMLNEVVDHSLRSLQMNGWFVPEGADADAVQEELAAASRHSLERAMSLDPDNFWTLLARHHDPLTYDDPEAAKESRALIDRMVSEFPKQPLGWLALGWAKHAQGDMASADSAFRKAIELDPFHAGVVYSSLWHFRNTGDQEMVTRLFERLAEIAPEKGEYTRLSETNVDTRLSNLVQAFWQTADESLIDRHGKILFDADSRFASPVSELSNYVQHWALRNEPDRILALEDRLELPEPVIHYDVVRFNRVALSMAILHLERGRRESAEYLAHRILATEPLPQAKFSQTLVINHSFYANACAVLGEQNCAAHWAEQALENAEGENPWSMFSAYLAVASVDLDRAVRLILGQKARDPRWFGTDVIAAFQIGNRDVLRHPDMIAFYRQEDKWMDYLSKRMPEYAAY
jgi:TolB-like protein